MQRAKTLTVFILLVPLLLGMTCNPKPESVIMADERCERVIGQLVRENAEMRKALQALQRTMDHADREAALRTKLLVQIAEEMRRYQCTISGLPITPQPTPSGTFGLRFE